MSTRPAPPRPHRIDQVIPSIVEHDAVSNHTFEAQRLLREMGFASEIFAAIVGPGCDGRVHPIGELATFVDTRSWLLYQCSIGSPVADAFAAHPGGKLLDYHNITPASLVERWIPALGEESRLGRAQLTRLAPVVPYAFADSAFNAAELDAVGFRTTRVVPLLIESDNLEAAPEPATLARLRADKAAGGVDWLFVGQVAPHKAQHELVAAFSCFREAYDPRARLHIVGREMGHAYRAALEDFVGVLGLSEAVELPGSVSAAQLAAYYAAADIFVCCSAHEGFCAPVAEAMTHSVPVVACDAGALAENIGDAGLLLERRDAPYVAAAVHEVLARPATRDALVAAGRARAAGRRLEETRRTFTEAIAEALTFVDAATPA